VAILYHWLASNVNLAGSAGVSSVLCVLCVRIDRRSHEGSVGDTHLQAAAEWSLCGLSAVVTLVMVVLSSLTTLRPIYS
jgi:hypothetical protein